MVLVADFGSMILEVPAKAIGPVASQTFVNPCDQTKALVFVSQRINRLHSNYGIDTEDASGRPCEDRWRLPLPVALSLP